MKSFLFTLMVLVCFQSMMSCKLDSVPPISPEELKFSKFDQVISSHKPLIGLLNKESFDNSVQLIGYVECTGLPSDNLTPGCPWVNEEDSVDWYGITVVIPIPKKQGK